MTPPLLTLRTFLAENGAPLPPWSAPAAVVDALCGLTAARRGDPRYINRLLTLERGLRPQLSGVGALDEAAVARLLLALRAPGPRGPLPRVSRAALALVALAACGGKETCDEAGDVPEAEADTYCEILSAIDGVDFSDKVALQECLADTPAADRETLAAALQGLDEDALIATLEAYYASEEACGYVDCGNCH